MNEIKVKKFDALPLKAHSFLNGIPIHSLDTVELIGGRERMTILDIYEATGLGEIGKIKVGFLTKFLFDLRGRIGKIMGWDDVPQLVGKNSYLQRLSADEKEKSLIPPGKAEGIARVLYCFECEMLLEIINRTVHCFWLLATEKTNAGYRLYNAVYVKKLNWRTPIYMTLISPILKWIIYPSINKSILENWERSFPAKSDKRINKNAAIKI